MAWDEVLLDASRETVAPILRFYSWASPSASFGYSQRIAEIEQMTLLRPLVRRITGGGLVPHDRDWTYSLSFPSGHAWYELSARESYRETHFWIQMAFAKIQVTTELSPCCQKEVPGQCFRGAEENDVLWKGRKIAGAAQKRTRVGLLIQGSVQPPPVNIPREPWELAMLETGAELFGISWSEFLPDPALQKKVQSLAENKYSRDDHNRKR